MYYFVHRINWLTLRFSKTDENNKYKEYKQVPHKFDYEEWIENTSYFIILQEVIYIYDV